MARIHAYMPSCIVIQLWFDFSCPYAYLASRRAQSLGVPIDWRPMLLGGVFRGIGAGDGPMATLSAAKARHNLLDMHRWADRFGAPFRMPPSHPMRTVRALRTLLALPHDVWPGAIEQIYAAYWQRGEDVTADATIREALLRAQIPAAAIDDALARADSDAIKDDLRRRTDEAIALGIFGAPAWIVSGALVWGQDRFPWLEAAIAGWAIDEAPLPGGPRATVLPAPPAHPVDVYYDVSSPYAYFALTQLPALAAQGVEIRLKPILLGALFKSIGQQDVPMFAMSVPKRAYVAKELARWSRWWGAPFEFPTKFPQRTMTAQRLALLAIEHEPAAAIPLALSLGKKMWAERGDLEDAATLASVLAANALPTEWIARTQEPAVKARLAENTAAAEAAGAFGVPSFVVNGRLFWGQDRLDLVAAAISGWTPPDPA